MDKINILAGAFSSVLLEWLGEHTLRGVVNANARELNPDVCHSHDECDANMAMLEAFEKTFPSEPFDLDSAEQVALFNNAWDKARENNFNLTM